MEGSEMKEIFLTGDTVRVVSCDKKFSGIYIGLTAKVVGICGDLIRVMFSENAERVHEFKRSELTLICHGSSDD